jgi:hypothetical protein
VVPIILFFFIPDRSPDRDILLSKYFTLFGSD